MVWGRGAVDMKNMDAMVLAVVRAWARHGVRPRRDIVLAFTADEEDSAIDGASFLTDDHPELFEGCTEGISESGGVTFHAGPGMEIYPIGAGERGTAWLRLTARGRTGHGSKVNRANAVSRLAAAIARIDAHEWPLRLTPTVRASLVELAALHGIEADPGADDFDADELLGKLGPAAALVDRSCATAPTRRCWTPVTRSTSSRGSPPDTSTAAPYPAARTIQTTMDELTGPDVDWDYYHRGVPLQAPVDSPTYRKLRAAIERFAPEGHVVPYCMSGGTDAKQFSRLGITGYGFAPLRMPAGLDYQALFHGVDERVPVDALHFGVRVLDHYLRSA